MYASLLAYLSVLKGSFARAVSLIDDALADPECEPLPRAHLYYYQALAYFHMGEHDYAASLAECARRYAEERKFLWVCERLAQLRAQLDAKKGVS